MKTAVSSVSFSKNPVLLDELQAAGFEPTPNRTGKLLTGEDLGRFLADHETAVVGTEVLDAAVLDLCPGLRYVAKYGVGLDNLDLPELKRRGIGVGFVPGVNRRSVAELVLGIVLGHCRNLFASFDGMRQGRWLKDGGRELSSLTVGLVGFGNTGTEVALLLKPLGSKILFCDIIDKGFEAGRLGARPSTYDDLVATADVLSFHVPGTPATKLMYGPKEIARAKSGQLVINTSRGSVVDFEAVCEAVKNGRLGGFAADVFPVEPDDLSRFRDQPRLYFTPHIGGNSQEAVLAMGRAAIAKLSEWKSG